MLQLKTLITNVLTINSLIDEYEFIDQLILSDVMLML